MSGHCPRCSTYHEEDDGRPCARCGPASGRLNDRLELAERLAGLRRRWFKLTRTLGAEADVREQDRLIRELESIETEVRSAVVDVAKMLKSDDKEIAGLRSRLERASKANARLVYVCRVFYEVLERRKRGKWTPLEILNFREKHNVPDGTAVEAWAEEIVGSVLRQEMTT